MIYPRVVSCNLQCNFNSSGPSIDTSTAAVGVSIGIVGASVSVTFVVSFSLGVLVASVLCYISRRSKESYKPSSHTDPATVRDEVGTDKKMEGNVIQLDTNTAYFLLSAGPLQ